MKLSICIGAAALAARLRALAGCATVAGHAGQGSRSAAATAATPSPQAIANAQRLAGAPGSTPPRSRPARRASSLRTVRRRQPRRQGAARPVPPLAEGRQGLDRDRARSVRPAVLLLDQPRPGPRREPLLRGLDDEQPVAPFGGPAIVVFRKVGAHVQLIARNVKYTAHAGTPEARAVADAFSDSLLATAPVVSQPHPERKSVLVDANALFFADLPGAAPRLEQAYRQSYAFDARNSSFRDVRSTRRLRDVQRDRALRARPRRDLRSPAAAARRAAVDAPRHPQPVPRLPLLAREAARHADAPARRRSRASATSAPTRWDFTTDDRRIPIVHFVNRWRLEKKDPAAALSEPKQPIVFWIDRTVPVKYRAAIREGVLEWNKAFERIGYKDAIRVEIQPDDADFNTSRHPPRVDPLDDDRAQRVRRDRPDGGRSAHRRDPRRRHRHRRDQLPRLQEPAAPRASRRARRPRRTHSPTTAVLHVRRRRRPSTRPSRMSLLEARGEMTLDGPEAEAFIQSQLKDTTMHEVGHTLGPHAQLPRVDDLHRGAARRPRVHASSTASPAR